MEKERRQRETDKERMTQRERERKKNKKRKRGGERKQWIVLFKDPGMFTCNTVVWLGWLRER